jgi:O-antigen/teichoic acid export membrane protein
MSVRARGRLLEAEFAWGMLDQGCSSATNFGLFVLAGHLLGPRGLGHVYIGFAAYLVAWGFQRALITDPLLVQSSGLDARARVSPTGTATTAVVVQGAAATAVLVVLGVALPGATGHSLLIFAPWLLPSLLQDLWRTALFRDERGRGAAISDGTWLVAMAAAVPLCLAFRSSWAVVAVWGLGASAGAVVAAGLAWVRPSGWSATWQWWRLGASGLGRWLALEHASVTVGNQATVFIVAWLLGTADLGGLRAVQAVFAPMTLLGPALSLPGVPRISRAMSTSVREGLRVAVVMSVMATVAVGAYIAVLVPVRVPVLTHVFGPGFGRFDNLIFPVAAGQLISSTGFALAAFLKCAGDGRALPVARIGSALSAIVLLFLVSGRFGVTGAAWALSAGSVTSTAVMVIAAGRAARPTDEAAARRYAGLPARAQPPSLPADPRLPADR